MKLRLCHIITGLNTGGAEMMLSKLVSSMDSERFSTSVISLTGIGSVGIKIQRLGIPVYSLGMTQGLPNPAYVFNLTQLLRRINPDVIQTWMYHADLIGGISAKLAGGVPVAWGIRHSDLDPRESKKLTIWTAKICAFLSQRLPSKIVCCSEASQRVHTDMGYDAHRMIVIPNGFDLDQFQPEHEAKARLRAMLGIAKDAPVIGHIARFDAQKDHQTLIEAASKLVQKVPNVQYVLCGDGITADNQKLFGWLQRAGVADCFHLLGRRGDISQLVPGFDIATSSSSFGEGFPNVVGEAMACAVPCVVTDVGDSALIVGNTGRVVMPQDPDALSNAWLEVLEMKSDAREALGAMALDRVRKNFSLPQIAAKYSQLYTDMAAQNGG